MLDVEQCPLNIPSKNIEDQTIPTFLGSILDGEQDTSRWNIMLVGQENVGKTALSMCLRGILKTIKDESILSTDGIEIERWQSEHVTEDKRVITTQFNVWDFAGQEIYYDTHQFFFSARTIYAVVWNLAQGDEDGRVSFWVDSIRGRVNAPIILIGTHSDLVKEKQAQTMLEAMAKKFSYCTTVAHVVKVSCRTGRGLQDVKQVFGETVAAQADATKKVPYTNIYLEEEINKLVNEASLLPLISSKLFFHVAKCCGVKGNCCR